MITNPLQTIEDRPDGSGVYQSIACFECGEISISLNPAWLCSISFSNKTTRTNEIAIMPLPAITPIIFEIIVISALESRMAQSMKSATDAISVTQNIPQTTIASMTRISGYLLLPGPALPSGNPHRSHGVPVSNDSAAARRPARRPKRGQGQGHAKRLRLGPLRGKVGQLEPAQLRASQQCGQW